MTGKVTYQLSRLGRDRMNKRPASWSNMKVIVTKVLQVILNRFQEKSIMVTQEDDSSSSTANYATSLPRKGHVS